jgi:hypothetical protein
VSLLNNLRKRYGMKQKGDPGKPGKGNQETRKPGKREGNQES